MEKKEDEDSKSFANESEEVDCMEKARALAEKSEDPKTQVSALIIASLITMFRAFWVPYLPTEYRHRYWYR